MAPGDDTVAELVGGGDAVAELVGVGVRIDGRAVLDDVTWRISQGERWVVLGPNGSGKSTLVQILAGRRHPHDGRVSLLGATLGRCDVRELWPRLAVVTTAVRERFPPATTARDAVATGASGATAAWFTRPDADGLARADALLGVYGCAGFGDRRVGTLSDGERQRVLLARAAFADPALLLLDEPCAGLDVAGREQLVTALAAHSADPVAPPYVLVTHHVEEIPPGATHVLLLRNGQVQAAGPIATTLTADALSHTFAFGLELDALAGGRWTARARPSR